jgi:hypothetical protein
LTDANKYVFIVLPIQREDSLEEEKAALRHLKQICREMFSFATRNKRFAPVGFDMALIACREIVIPELQEWFKKELKKVLEDAKTDVNLDDINALSVRWMDLDANNIVIAAKTQLSAKDPENSRIWYEALTIPRYGTIALLALGVDAETLADLLGLWWDTQEEKKRGKEISFIVERFLDLEGSQDALKNLLKHKGGGWSIELRMTINRELEARHIDPIFPALPRKPVSISV